MIRDITIGQYYPAEKCTAPSGSESEAGGNTVVFDFVILI